MASSLSRKFGCDTESRSTRPTTAPAMKAPRMLSRPNCSARATNATRSTTAARTRICAVVSCSRVRVMVSRRERATNIAADRRRTHERSEGHEQHQPAAGGGVRGGEQQREQHDRGEVGHRRGRHDGLAEARLDLAGVLEHGHDEAERRGGESDRDEARAVHPPDGVESETGHDTEHERRGVPDQGESQHLPLQPLQVDLQAGQEEQEREAEKGRRSRPGGPPRPSRVPGVRRRSRRRSPARRRAAGAAGPVRGSAAPAAR